MDTMATSRFSADHHPTHLRLATSPTPERARPRAQQRQNPGKCRNTIQ